MYIVWFFLNHLLSILEGNHSYLMYDKGVFRRDAEGLAKETFCQLGVVSESVLQTNVKHGQVTSAQTGSQKVFFFLA